MASPRVAPHAVCPPLGARVAERTLLHRLPSSIGYLCNTQRVVELQPGSLQASQQAVQRGAGRRLALQGAAAAPLAPPQLRDRPSLIPIAASPLRLEPRRRRRRATTAIAAASGHAPPGPACLGSSSSVAACRHREQQHRSCLPAWLRCWSRRSAGWQKASTMSRCPVAPRAPARWRLSGTLVCGSATGERGPWCRFPCCPRATI